METKGQTGVNIRPKGKMRESTKLNGKSNKGWKPAAKMWQKRTTAGHAGKRDERENKRLTRQGKRMAVRRRGA